MLVHDASMWAAIIIVIWRLYPAERRSFIRVIDVFSFEPYGKFLTGQKVSNVGQHLVVFGSITLQSLHCPFAIENEQYSPDLQPDWCSTLHVEDVEVSRMSTIRKIWHNAATRRRVAHPAAASRGRALAGASEVGQVLETLVAFRSETTRSSEMKYTELESSADASWMHPPPTQSGRRGGPSECPDRFADLLLVSSCRLS